MDSKTRDQPYAACTLCRVRFVAEIAILILGFCMWQSRPTQAEPLSRNEEPPRRRANIASSARAAEPPQALAPARTQAIDDLLDSSQWWRAEVLREEPWSCRDRVQMVKLLVGRGLGVIDREREHPVVASYRRRMLVSLHGEAAAAVRRVDGHDTREGGDRAILVALVDRMTRDVLPETLDRYDATVARSLRTLPAVRDRQSAQRARARVERALSLARQQRLGTVADTILRALDALVRETSTPGLLLTVLAGDVAGNGDPDDPTMGVLGAVPEQRRAAVASGLLGALAHAARSNPNLPPPPPPPPPSGLGSP